MNPRTPKTKREAGYSLVEVTLALLVVAIGLTSTFSLFPEAMKNTRAAISDAEVALFADYVFSTLAVGAAVEGTQIASRLSDTDDYASLVLSQKHLDKIELREGSILQFYWIPKDDDMGTSGGQSDPEAWHLAENAGYWSTAFTYRLTCAKRDKGNNRDTIYATLEVWPGEWKSKDIAKHMKPYVFYREILPYPNL